jgi:hypothetical protein
MQLAAFSSLIQFDSMKIQKPLRTNANLRLLLLVPVIYSMALAACSDLAPTPQTHQAFNLQSAVIRDPRTDDHVTIAPRTYNLETRGFDRPWPFGPESDAR